MNDWAKYATGGRLPGFALRRREKRDKGGNDVSRRVDSGTYDREATRYDAYSYC